MTQENDNDNLLDFTAYKLRNMVEHMADTGQEAMAYAMQEALDQYLLGDINIIWQSGWPHVIQEKDTGT